MGPLFRALFGILSKGDLRAVSRNVDMLIERTDEMGHIIEESLSLINATSTEGKKNRDSIIMLVNYWN